jgi:thiol-disulfide isomerase/thioredoxin
VYRIIIFTKPTCSPCKHLSLIMSEVVIELGLNVTKIDVSTEKGQKHSEKYNISIFPTIFVLQDNKIIKVLDEIPIIEDLEENKKVLINLFKDYVN